MFILKSMKELKNWHYIFFIPDFNLLIYGILILCGNKNPLPNTVTRDYSYIFKGIKIIN
ncbi:hypothetical protein XBP1_1050007 [Xenorhabdus bovienii str. puntauvense]|uniref:Uncharacterized protein n=3 Tax=Xenorhabdus bovienii TaxID=40576 RepID=A0A0B6XF49_XENBV|nr:hypothetical protein XBFFR1_900049 [Xenorhabdus bovienii str. feltiae France]CDG93592.1 hypothetical protein XBFFL1_2560048 [Xenorhabdus bovienii str. feltiae Florida]CDG95116.1 hypothetical protein XBP1_1050007 [Xenorhabdus bovienii str. puntauvense]CDH26245.1 hypothetical protein XBKB1_530012 [Xenorhabdus bovienii str. kraussei Becker Underwood]CDM91463.1 protein of unknown function [Xenorhabdus bovienii]